MNVRNVMSKLLCFDSGNISCASVLTINNFRRHIRKSATKSDFHNLVLVTSLNRNIEHISMLLSQFRARTPVFVQVALHQIWRHAIAFVLINSLTKALMKSFETNTALLKTPANSFSHAKWR